MLSVEKPYKSALYLKPTLETAIKKAHIQDLYFEKMKAKAQSNFESVFNVTLMTSSL